jgi:hypothetical protein
VTGLFDMPFDPFSPFDLISCEPVMMIKPAGAIVPGNEKNSL